jgi:hypothetical protein
LTRPVEAGRIRDDVAFVTTLTVMVGLALTVLSVTRIAGGLGFAFPVMIGLTFAMLSMGWLRSRGFTVMIRFTFTMLGMTAGSRCV